MPYRTITIIRKRELKEKKKDQIVCTDCAPFRRYASLWWFMTEPLNIIKTRNKSLDCGKFQGLQYVQCSFAKMLIIIIIIVMSRKTTGYVYSRWIILGLLLLHGHIQPRGDIEVFGT